jgi:hypothetical protein
MLRDLPLLAKKWKGMGWYPDSDDTLYAVQKERHVTVFVWNRPGVREELAAVLAAPTFSEPSK